MNKIIFSSEDERKYALACLTFAKRLSLISDDSLDAVYDRCNKENENRKKKLEKVHRSSGFAHATLLVGQSNDLTHVGYLWF